MLYRNFLSPHRITNWRLIAPVHFGLDLVALLVAWYTAIQLRVYLNPWMPTQISVAQVRGLVPHPLVIVVLWTIVALWVGLYRRKKTWSAARAIRQAIESDIIACALAIVVTFFSRGAGNDISRSFIFLFGPVSLFLLSVSFYMTMFVAYTLQKRWVEPKRIAVLGDGDDLTALIRNIEDAGTGSLRVAGVILPQTTRVDGAQPSSLPVLGTVHQLAEVINREKLDQLICMSSLSTRDFELCGAISNRMGVTLSRPLATPLWYNVRYEFNSEYGLDLLDAQPVAFSHNRELIKRTVDIVTASFLFIVLSPLLLFLAILIRLTSAGPVIYKSRRVGRGGRHFMFWKFRSMYMSGPRREDLRHHNERDGHLFKMRNDPRVTPLGRFMRRFSLDELPQLYNVLAGEMSLVGPRPLPAEDMNPDGLSTEHFAWAEQRVQVRPGITGIWQIRGRSDLTFEQMVEFDLEYVRNWSLAMDLQLLLETPLAVFTGRGAY
jgi:exopolysaccharide biosynthesis polyprenyl glycosylphosphotransferase